METRPKPAASRARRFEMSLPVSYRPAEESHWHRGVTHSISATGMLIQADGPITPAESITFAISLPSPAGRLIGEGHVIRVFAPAWPAEPPFFAIAVDQCHIEVATPN